MRGASRQRSLASYSLSFAGLVVLAKSLNPIPSRTRPLNSSAPMVLWLKPWESRSLPGLPRTRNNPLSMSRIRKRRFPPGGGVFCCPCCLAWQGARFSVMIRCLAAARSPGGRPSASGAFRVRVPVHSRFISKSVRSPPLEQKSPHTVRRLPCAR